jgi:signal transduction histidine kinase
MKQPQTEAIPTSKMFMLMPYLADLELEIDRLRKQEHFVQHEAREFVKQIQLLSRTSAVGEDLRPVLDAIEQNAAKFSILLRDIREPSGYHPAHDQVTAIALRPLIEQVFRRQQRLEGSSDSVLHLELETDHVEWFPVRLRHVLDNLLSNAVKYRDPDKDDAWIRVVLRVLPGHYELRISDNGMGIPEGEDCVEVLQLLYRAAATRATGLGVGLAVVKMLVQQSGGTLAMESREGQGTSFVVVLPRYDVDDYLA